MRVASATIVVAGLVIGGEALASTQKISGTWQRGDGLATVTIMPCGPSICAVNTWVKDEASGESVGDRLVMSVSPQSEDTLSGTAYDPQRDLTYSIDISVGDQQMKTRGCVLAGLLCKSVAWTKQ